MRRRVQNSLGDMDLGYICTFHSFCVQFLSEEINVVNFPKNFLVLDTDDQKEILNRIFADMGLDSKNMTVKEALDEILEARKLKAVTYIDYFYLLDNEALKIKFESTGNQKDAIFLRYLYEQKKLFGLDFNDLIAFTVYILERFPEIRQKWQEKIQYVMVDEFQDVSARQYELARILAGFHGNIFIVGDPDQSIYAWRGAHAQLFLDFDKIYPNAKTIDLGINYRSTPEIAAAANRLIGHNAIRLPRFGRSIRESGPKPIYFHAGSDKLENEWICQEIEKLRAAGTSLNDVAILYRAHRYVTRDLEEKLTDKKLPYRIYSGIEFYRRREIKEVVGYLRMIAFGDDLAFLRTHNTPRRKMGRKTREFLRAKAEMTGVTLYQALKDNLRAAQLSGTLAHSYVQAIEICRERRNSLPLDNLLQTILDLSGYERHIRLQGDQERLDNVADLKRHVAEYGQDNDATLEDFLSKVALFSDVDRNSPLETIRLMTIHAAKGLEFKQVFLIGLSEGVLPSHRGRDPEDIEEERRLCYVAMTRAIDGLRLSDSAGRTGEGLKKLPSRFLGEIGRDLLAFVNPVDESLLSAKSNVSSFAAPKNLLAEGDRVCHRSLGLGRIIRVDLDNHLYEVKFDNLATFRSLRFNAPLTLLSPDAPDVSDVPDGIVH
jgi:DNA helicase-2/ATP-dependent DNA helicase PcrA